MKAIFKNFYISNDILLVHFTENFVKGGENTP